MSLRRPSVIDLMLHEGTARGLVCTTCIRLPLLWQHVKNATINPSNNQPCTSSCILTFPPGEHTLLLTRWEGTVAFQQAPHFLSSLKRVSPKGLRAIQSRHRLMQQ